MAPERAGTTGTRIGIRRHATVEGVDPYDAVRWERRDSRITNYRDGSVAFEQLGVEVPTTWSLNATNILAQKYFRGTLGTPERETSLKQVADRIVDTIAAWGRRDGYFADDGEAEAFEAELKHLIVTQRAAFNSPVWFNIGVEGVPQQASACQPWSALVSTPDGLVPIGRLVDEGAVGAKVFDAAGLTSVVAVKANGTKAVLRVALSGGHALEVTADHLVWRATRPTAGEEGSRGLSSGEEPWSEGSGGFVPAGELVAGDRLEWHRVESWGEGEITGEALAEATLVGWAQGDGAVAEVEAEASVVLELVALTEAEQAWLARAAARALPVDPASGGDALVDGPRIRVAGAGVAELVERYGLGARRGEAAVPSSLYAAPAPVVARYLRSLFSSAGFVSPSCVAMEVESHRLASGVASLLGRFGIFASVAPVERGGVWSVTVEALGDRRLFADQVGFVDPRAHARLEAGLDLGGEPAWRSTALEVVAIDDLGEREVYDIQTESGEYLSDGLRVHNCFILSVDDTMDSILNWYVEEGTIFKGGSGAGINLSRIRSSKEHLKGGGTASGPVSFMRGADASAGTIKSGGKTRRAAKMVILDADHPDIEDFIWCKAVEERKARVLRDAGFDMDLDGVDSHSTQYQNANNSVRVTDEFMQAVVDDDDWHYRAVTTGEVIQTVKARGLMRQIAQAAWECADPGMQFDTTINRWHTSANTGRINGSNPCCLVGETLVETDEGPIPIARLEELSHAGAPLPAVVAYDLEEQVTASREVLKAWIAGRTAALVEIRTEADDRFRCTPEHRFLTEQDRYVEASALEAGTRLRSVRGSAVVRSVTRLQLDEPVPVYDLEIEGTHNFAVNGGVAAVVAHNSEYMHLDDSACNLASLNLLTFLDESGHFDVEGFMHAVEVVFTAQEILVGNADYPTEKIAETSRRFRQLGLGYANLGAMLMALGLPYDSDEGRAWAAAITALMTGHAYATSAKTAARMGPFAGYAENEEHVLRVLDMHRDAAAEIDDLVPAELLEAARQVWDDALEWGEEYGVRNAQASVLAPTGCLVGGSLVPTERGLVRLRSLGDPEGAQWQDLGVSVMTDEGEREATKFYVNGLEPVVDVVTSRGHRLSGTTKHRIMVVTDEGGWEWRRFADLRSGDQVPLALDQLLGEPQHVPLPPLPDAYWTGEHRVTVPRSMNPELAEFVGYFMGDGSLHARGIRMCVDPADLDVVERLRILGKELFGLEAHVTPTGGYLEVAFHSVRLVLWWEACGFAKRLPHPGHVGNGHVPHIPDAVLHSNDRAAYGAFLRGLFEADGTVNVGYPSWTTTCIDFSHEVQSLLLALGYPTTRKFDTSGRGSRLAVLRLLNLSLNPRWLDEVGFIGERKNRGVAESDAWQASRYDDIPITRQMVDELVPANGRLRRNLLQAVKRGVVSRSLATELFEATGDAEVERLLGFFYDRVASAELGDEELTYDLSVPENVTYLANGFISHNTIGLLMDCDTTGVEPDLGLVKMKKLVGGGTMSIVNQTVPRALRRLGYAPEQVEDIIRYIDEQKSILGAPHLRSEHVPVFACSMGDNTIHHSGHIKMMGAVQNFLSGAISKTVNLPEEVTVEEVEQLHIDAWQLGVKAIAMYRDNCKVAQPLSTGKKATAKEPADVLEAFPAAELMPAQVVERIVERIVREPTRQKMPRNRPSRTFEFRVADCKGFVTVGEYEDGRPGEIFMKVSKQGSTLAGIMDSFAIAISFGLQYGVPLRAFVEQFTNMRFEPAGMTDDPDIRFASSLIDYIFRRLAVDYLPLDERMELGILSVGERTNPTLPGIEEATTESVQGQDVLGGPPSQNTASVDLVSAADPTPHATTRGSRSDAPYCMQCGVQMQRAGSCHACPSCGTTSGCS